MTIPDSDFGRRVSDRLDTEGIIWLTTISKDGTPQPNPVWFVRDGDDAVLTYNANDATRLRHVAVRPRVSLHFNHDSDGNDVVVIAAVAEQVLDAPPCDQHVEYVAKYASGMVHVSGDAATFAAYYSVPLRIRFTKVRGFVIA